MRYLALGLPALLFVACGGTEPTPEPLPDPVLTIGPEEPCTSQDLVATLEDGTAAAWRWTVGGQTTEVDGPVVSSELTEKGQRWRVAVDVQETGTTLTADLMVVNCAPVIHGVSFSPSEPTGVDTLVATVDVEDPDGDMVTLRYRWLVNDEEIYAGSSGRTEFSRSLEGLGRGAVVGLEVVATDGLLDSEPATASIELVNTPPTAPVVQIDPDGALIDDDLVCRIVEPSVDIDGDPITYEFTWSVNGTLFSDTLTTEHPGDTVPYTATNDEDLWRCSAVASDGEATSDAASHEVRVVAWTGPRMFTNCGATLQTGPTESACRSAYGGTTLADDTLTVSGGIQRWVVPRSGAYRIEVQGARGGGVGSTYGRGARMRGTFELEEGQVLKILVGQHGPHAGTGSGGGGGGTFVTLDDNTPLIIAGGGGGQYTSSSARHNADATVSTSGMSTGCTSGGSDGGGGSGCSGNNGASGGGGLTGNGSNGRWGTAGLSLVNGGTGGGTSWSADAVGAFGGGGGTHGSTGGGGGGGGYSGGAGGFHNTTTGAGGGGGSFNAGADQDNEAGVGDDHGHVIIDRE